MFHMIRKKIFASLLMRKKYFDGVSFRKKNCEHNENPRPPPDKKMVVA